MCIYLCIYVSISIYMYMYIHIHIHIYVCMYTYIYIYTYISYMPHTPMRVHSGPRDTDGARRCYPGRTLRKGAPVSGHRGHCLPLPRQQAWLASAASAEGLRRMSTERSRKGPMPEGAHRDLTSDRRHGTWTGSDRGSYCTNTGE